MQLTEQWFTDRCGKATASCFADVMATIKSGEAAARRNYRAQLLCERLTGKTTETFTSKAMRDGIEREPLARMAYEVQTGLIVNEVGFIAHGALAAGASPDGLIALDGGLEIKCPQPATHLDYLFLDDVPTEYKWQVHGGMWITGRQWWDFASFNPDFPEDLQLKIIRVKRDEELITQLENGVTAFLDELDAAMVKLKGIQHG